jgi:hypothetical protein
MGREVTLVIQDVPVKKWKVTTKLVQLVILVAVDRLEKMESLVYLACLVWMDGMASREMIVDSVLMVFLV